MALSINNKKTAVIVYLGGNSIKVGITDQLICGNFEEKIEFSDH